MITGNMTLSPKPTHEDYSDGICESCLCACTEVALDESFSDSFGLVTNWAIGSGCCGADVLEGHIFLDKVSIHTARKDHKDGKVLVGQRYRQHITKGYYIDSSGEHHGICDISKKILKEKYE